MERRVSVSVVLLVVVAMSVGCGREPVPAEATPLGLQPDVAQAAKQEVSEASGVPVEEIEIVRANQVEWTDTLPRAWGCRRVLRSGADAGMEGHLEGRR